MNLTIQRAALLKPLQMIGGIVERRQTLPILANVLLTLKDNTLFLTGTDLEIEMIGRISLEEKLEDSTITVSARKLLDICRALPEDAELKLKEENGTLTLRSDKSRFLLTTLSAHDFPSVEEAPFTTQFQISKSKLKKLLNKTHFAMGQQDVRHYLNGTLFAIQEGAVVCVATDGHRLAYSSISDIEVGQAQLKVILPRKSVLELIRLLDNSEEMTTVCVGENHFRIITADFTFTSKLINAQYPDYNKLIPKNGANVAISNREIVKQALVRASILSNEKFRSIRLQLEKDLLRILANNPEHEEAEELVQMDYQGSEGVEIGFNVAYLLDAISTIEAENIQWSFNDPSGGVLIHATDKETGKDYSLYVVMPMRL